MWSAETRLCLSCAAPSSHLRLPAMVLTNLDHGSQDVIPSLLLIHYIVGATPSRSCLAEWRVLAEAQRVASGQYRALPVTVVFTPPPCLTVAASIEPRHTLPDAVCQ